jgi:hypothetical protein
MKDQTPFRQGRILCSAVGCRSGETIGLESCGETFERSCRQETRQTKDLECLRQKCKRFCRQEARQNKDRGSGHESMNVGQKRGSFACVNPRPWDPGLASPRIAAKSPIMLKDTIPDAASAWWAHPSAVRALEQVVDQATRPRRRRVGIVGWSLQVRGRNIARDARWALDNHGIRPPLEPGCGGRIGRHGAICRLRA